ARRRARVPNGHAAPGDHQSVHEGGEREMKEIRAHAGFPIKPVYGPEDVADVDFERDIGRPGEYPFTRGIHTHMYRARPWTMRQYVGFGTPKETNSRFKYLMRSEERRVGKEIRSRRSRKSEKEEKRIQ